MSLIAGNGVLKGKISIGPLCPVERIPPDPKCQATPEMYAARKIFVYQTDKITLVTTITPDNRGQFSLSLPAGTYYLNMASQTIGNISGLPATVQIENNKTISLEINVDTGIR